MFPFFIQTVFLLEPDATNSLAVVAIVRLEVLSEPTADPGNVYGVRPDGAIAWQLSPLPAGERGSPFVGVGPDKDGRGVWCYNWDGVNYRVDPQTGAVLESFLARF